jgi:hypothetical protein
MKNNNRRVPVLYKLIGAMFLLLGCAAVPLQDMSNARQALQAAERVQAKQYAQEDYKRAELLLDEAERLMRSGQYDSARELAQRAKAIAVAARAASLAARTQKK